MSSLPTSTTQVCSDCDISVARAYFERRVHKPLGIVDYFSSTKQNLLITIHDKTYQKFAAEGTHEISLSFAQAPSGRNVDPIKQLLLFDSVQRHRTFKANGFRFSFPKVYDLNAIAWSIAIAYRTLGYQCRIVCGTEDIDVDALIADVSPSPIWKQSGAVACA